MFAVSVLLLGMDIPLDTVIFLQTSSPAARDMLLKIVMLLQSFYIDSVLRGVFHKHTLSMNDPKICRKRIAILPLSMSLVKTLK